MVSINAGHCTILHTSQPFTCITKETDVKEDLLGNMCRVIGPTGPSSATGRKAADIEYAPLALKGVAIVAFLVSVEMLLRCLLASMRSMHPLLENETNRSILARHVGVDAFSCFVVFVMGWKSRYLLNGVLPAPFGPANDRVTPSTFEGRIFGSHPTATALTLFFFSYQLKNTFDTIVWDDGALFIAHHILTLGTAWTPLIYPSAPGYALFYFGISELSTGVLCLLANFDDDHGVPGLADAFPMLKITLGGLFAVLFVVCRVYMWSAVSICYCRDAWAALGNATDPRLSGRKLWLRYTFVSLSLLSLLQIIWLAEIARVGYVELKQVGLL